MNNQNRTIFNQLLEILPKYQFDNLVGQHNWDRYVKKFTCRQQLITMLYAQATWKDSLRDLELSLKLHSNKWYNLWLKSSSRNTIANANSNRSYIIFEKLFYILLAKCKELDYSKEFKFKNNLYSLDASVIDLCLNMFSWAKYRTTKGAIKLHLLYNNKSFLPEFLNITDWKQHEITIAKLNEYNLPKWSIIAIDRWYIDYKWFDKLDKDWLYFVTRAKSNMDYITIKENIINESNILSDIIVKVFNRDTIYKNKSIIFRRIEYYDTISKKKYIFITNNYNLSAKTIASIYKSRWDIELFFKWIKQNLKIKSFLWTSKNAVMTQIRVAMIYYLLIYYIKYKTKLKLSLLDFTRIIKEKLMDRISLIDILWIPFNKISLVKNKWDPWLNTLFPNLLGH